MSDDPSPLGLDYTERFPMSVDVGATYHFYFDAFIDSEDYTYLFVCLVGIDLVDDIDPSASNNSKSITIQ